MLLLDHHAWKILSSSILLVLRVYDWLRPFAILSEERRLKMNGIPLTTRSISEFHIVGVIAILAGIIVGITAMLLVTGLQLLLIFKVLAFEQQVLWVTLAMILGVGSWLVVTGLVARSTGRLPNSLLMNAIAVPYIGYPVWAFRIGVQLLGW
jgi:hypothetical protein